MPDPIPFVHRLRVRYVEVDMQGHVYNAHYFTWMDIAHTELWASAVGPYGEFVASGLEFVTAEASARFRQGAKFDEDVDIEVVLETLSTTSMTSIHTMRRGDEVLVEGRLRHVCVDHTMVAKQPWPESVRAALAPHIIAGS
jgi:acyl-CoA thioester hydrolase